MSFHSIGVSLAAHSDCAPSGTTGVDARPLPSPSSPAWLDPDVVNQFVDGHPDFVRAMAEGTFPVPVKACCGVLAGDCCDCAEFAASATAVR